MENKRFSYKDVMESQEDYFELGERLRELTGQGKIRPIKSAGKVPFQPYFYKEYYREDLKKKRKGKSCRSEINQLSPRLLEYYISHEDQYEEDAEWLIPLSDWMKKEETEECSLKERSYEIFRNEKMLEEKDVQRILNRCSLTYEDLCAFRTFEPFFCNLISSSGKALVLENKDPWYSITRALKQKNTDVFLGEKIQAVIYGEGRKADSGAVNSRLQDFLSGLEYRPESVLYAGDIDRAGVNILAKCREVNPEFEVVPFHALYEQMIRKAPEDALENEPSDDHNTKTWDRSFASMFAEAEYVNAVLDHNLRIPQEILKLPDYLEYCGDSHVPIP